MKKLVQAACAALLALALSTVSLGAEGAYSVYVSSNWISFVRNGVAAGGYALQSADITVGANAQGELLVCFYTSQGSYVGVTLGSQQSLTVGGAVDTLDLHETLDRPVVLQQGSKVQALAVNAPVKVSIWGEVQEVGIYDEALVIAADGAAVGQVEVYDSAAWFYAYEGARVGEQYNGTTTRAGQVVLRTNTIYARYGDTLRDLQDVLEDSVWAYDGDNGQRVEGTAQWAEPLNTQVTRSKSYTFRFIPEEAGYQAVSGTVRVSPDGADLDLELEVGSIRVARSGARLSSYLDELEDSVTAYNEDGRVVRGQCKWVSPSKQVRQSGWYEFLFIPTNTRYPTLREEIEVLVEGDGQEDVFTGEVTLRISDIEVHASARRLGSLQSQLERNVRAYNEDGRRLSGQLEWVDDASTLVQENGDYEFLFIPDNGDYEEVYDWISIYLD